jgi:anti-sigma B factor antagonist
MTALSRRDGNGLDLVCDGCGESLQRINCMWRDWPVVWGVVTHRGWSGSPRAIGPHRCPDCGRPADQL